MAAPLAWWQRGVIYQLLLRSFKDSNGDGIGDLRGLTQKLDYLQSLGVCAVWITPIYPSPWEDAGYDITEHCDVEPRYGTLADFDELVAAAGKRDLRIILDWVPNHTSDLHPWFVEARKSKGNPRRDWYIWADPDRQGGPPNNWLSVFGGSAWQLDEATGQYYYHAFLPEQPDLNWRNPEVKEAMLGTMRFWLERGAGGLRIDALDMLLEHTDLPDNPVNPDFDPSGPPDMAVFQHFSRDQPGMHAIVAQFRRLANRYPDCVLLGEAYTDIKRLTLYYGTPEDPELHLPLNPAFLRQQWQADEIWQGINDYLAAVPPHGWPTWSLGNHDMNRLAGRAQGPQLRVAAMLLMTLRGTPTLYYGDEIGMHDVPVPHEMTEDPQGKNQPDRSRDVARTAMQWDDSPHAGFTTGRPSIVVGSDYRELNVGAQERDPSSLLNLYRRLIALRKEKPALSGGAQSAVQRRAPTIAYLRKTSEQRILVILNLAGDSFSFDFTDYALRAQILLSTHPGRERETLNGTIAMHGNEGVILELAS